MEIKAKEDRVNLLLLGDALACGREGVEHFIDDGLLEMGDLFEHLGCLFRIIKWNTSIPVQIEYP